MKTMSSHFVRTFLLFVAAAAVLAGACLLRGETNLAATAGTAVADGATTPFTRDLLLGELSRKISSHFNLEGELQLELIRAWTPPSRVASTWDLQVLEYPAVTSSS